MKDGDGAATLEDLAVGFALDELSDGEMEELLTALKGRDERAAEAARYTWQALRTTMDLRVSLNTDFVAVTRERVEGLMRERSRPGLLAGILGRIGFRRPALETVEIPTGRRPRRRWWPAALTVLLAALLVGGIAWWATRDPTVVRLEVGSGTASCEGRRLVAGTAVDLAEGTLNVHRGGSVGLTWDDGSTMTLAGPASLVPRENGVSLIAGGAHLEARQGFVLGLPDRRITVSNEADAGRHESPCTITVEVLPGETLDRVRSLVGVLTGELTVTGLEGTPITPGHYQDEEGRIRPWIFLDKTPVNGQLDLEVDGQDAWGLRGRFAPAVIADRLRFTDAAGAWVEFGLGKARWAPPDGTAEVRDLAEAPLRPREFTLKHRDGITTLEIEGLAEVTAIPFGPPRQVTGHERLTLHTYCTGPWTGPRD